jgi:hypothetical protein
MSDLQVSKKALAEAKATKKSKQPFMGLYNNESIKVSKAPSKSKMDYKY